MLTPPPIYFPSLMELFEIWFLKHEFENFKDHHIFEIIVLLKLRPVEIQSSDFKMRTPPPFLISRSTF